MDCQIIFYIAQKTGYCEHTLRKKLEHTKLNIAAVSAAATVKELGSCLASAVSSYDITIIIGGLSRRGNTNIVQVLSRAFNKTNSNLQIKKIINPNGGDDGYILESGSQLIMVLPDDPDCINSMVSNSLLKYLSAFFGLEYTPAKNEPNIDLLIEINDYSDIGNTSPGSSYIPADTASQSNSVSDHQDQTDESDDDSEYIDDDTDDDDNRKGSTWLYVLAIIAALITVGVVVCDALILGRI